MRKSTGLAEQTIETTEIENTKFKVVDVGGVKNERKKWIHQFEDVASVIYVVSLSSYDEPVYEDDAVNSMKDSIQCFGDLLNENSHWFKQSVLYLIFNKKDVFERKIVDKSLKECFEDDYDEKEYWHDLDDKQKIGKNIEFIK